MQLVKRKNFIIFLAAILVFGFSAMALFYSKYSKVKIPLSQTEIEIQQIQKQSKSDDVDQIEKDLNSTDLVDIDKELQDIEKELDATY